MSLLRRLARAAAPRGAMPSFPPARARGGADPTNPGHVERAPTPTATPIPTGDDPPPAGAARAEPDAAHAARSEPADASDDHPTPAGSPTRPARRRGGQPPEAPPTPTTPPPTTLPAHEAGRAPLTADAETSAAAAVRPTGEDHPTGERPTSLGVPEVATGRSTAPSDPPPMVSARVEGPPAPVPDRVAPPTSIALPRREVSPAGPMAQTTTAADPAVDSEPRHRDPEPDRAAEPTAGTAEQSVDVRIGTIEIHEPPTDPGRQATVTGFAAYARVRAYDWTGDG